MRWLALAVLGGCHFAPGAAETRGDASSPDVPPDRPIDVPTDVAIDAPPDMALPAEKVRLIDLTDAQITGGPHTDFPLFISLSATWLADTAHGGDVARADGFDIYFSADQAGSTRLAHEVELYAPATGTLTAWVKIPSLVATTTLYIHYGSTSITTSQQNVAQVWSGGYRLVMHMDAISDSTGQSTSFNVNASTSAAGKLDNAMTFDGSTSYIDTGSATAIDDIFTGGGTAEGWFYANSYGEAAYGRLFDKNQENGWGMYIADVAGVSLQGLAFRHGGNASIGSWFTPDNSITLGAWHHAAVVYDQGSANNTPIMYVDGVALATHQVDVPTGPMDSDAAANLTIGNRANQDRTFDGSLDEMRLSAGARSAGWIATEVSNQSNPSGFYTVSAPL